MWFLNQRRIDNREIECQTLDNSAFGNYSNLCHIHELIILNSWSFVLNINFWTLIAIKLERQFKRIMWNNFDCKPLVTLKFCQRECSLTKVESFLAPAVNAIFAQNIKMKWKFELNKFIESETKTNHKKTNFFFGKTNNKKQPTHN